MKTRRLSIPKPSVAAVLLVAAVVLVVSARPAYAYVDPSVVTYTIQALAAVAVALSAVAGVAFRRTRKVFFKLLGIDEDAGKVIEPAVSRISPLQKNYADARFEKELAARSDAVEDKPLPWGSRLWRALLASAFLFFTVFVVAPLEITLASASDLIFNIEMFWQPVVIAAAIGCVVFALLLTAFRGKAFRVAVAVVVGLTIAAYIEVMFLNAPLPVADGTPVPWQDYDKITLVSAVVWIAIVAIFAVLAYRIPRVCSAVSIALGLALTIIQAVGVGSLIVAPKASGVLEGSGTIMVTERGLFNVSDKNNVIVFVLDTMDTVHVLNYLEDYPDTLDEFTGFTFYTNSTGSMIPTRYAVPSMLTAHDISDYATYDEYFKSGYANSRFLDDMLDRGYSLGIYTTNAIWDEASSAYMSERTVNIYDTSVDNSVHVDWLGTIKVLWKCALYRDLPWALKPRFWFDTEEINNGMVSSDGSGEEDAPFVFDDELYFKQLKEIGLSVSDEGGEGDLRFIHLLGSHAPYTLNLDGITELEGTNEEIQTIATLRMVREYLRQLKELGLYDQATIIVTADHGEWYLTTDDLYEPSSPIMLVKPSQTAAEAAQPLKYSEVPVSHIDLQPTILEAMGADDATLAAYEGMVMWEVPDAPRLRLYYTTLNDREQNKKDVAIKEWAIDGNALDFNDWYQTGRVWDTQASPEWGNY